MSGIQMDADSDQHHPKREMLLSPQISRSWRATADQINCMVGRKISRFPWQVFRRYHLLYKENIVI